MDESEREIERLLTTLPNTGPPKPRRPNPVTITRSDGSSQTVSPKHFKRRRRKPKPTRYGNYLRSSHWRKLRKLILERDRACVRCGSTKRLQVHHLTYERLGEERLGDLTTLCRGCHKRHHALLP